MNIPNLSDFKIPGLPPAEEMKTMTVTLRHFLIASWAVPATRVRALVPDHFALDTLKVGGETCAILQTTCFFNDNFHYTPLPRPSLDFWQSTYRVLTRSPLREDTMHAATPGHAMLRHDPGAWFFHTHLGTRASWVIQRAVAADAEYADFNIITREANNGADYHQYIVDITPPAAPANATVAVQSPQNSTQNASPTQIAVRSVNEKTPVAPFADWNKMVHFLTFRLNGYYQMSSLTGGENIGVLSVEHQLMQPIAAELVPIGGEVREARLGLWEKLGLMSQDEMRRPFALLIQPEIVFVSHAPKLLRAESLSTHSPTRQSWQSGQ